MDRHTRIGSSKKGRSWYLHQFISRHIWEIRIATSWNLFQKSQNISTLTNSITYILFVRWWLYRNVVDLRQMIWGCKGYAICSGSKTCSWWLCCRYDLEFIFEKYGLFRLILIFVCCICWLLRLLTAEYVVWQRRTTQSRQLILYAGTIANSL